MKYKERDPFKVVIIRLIFIMLAVQIVMLIWVVRRGQADEMERNARIEQFQTEWVTYALEDLAWK